MLDKDGKEIEPREKFTNLFRLEWGAKQAAWFPAPAFKRTRFRPGPKWTTSAIAKWPTCTFSSQDRARERGVTRRH